MLAKDIAEALSARPTLFDAIAEGYFDEIGPDDDSLRLYNEFLSLSLQINSPKTLSRWLIDYLPRAGRGTKRERLLFQIALSQCWKGGAWATERFEELSSLAEARPDLKQAYDEVVAEEIPGWRRRNSEREIARGCEDARQMKATLERLARDLPTIRAGRHDGWLGWAASIYFADFDDLEAYIPPIERLNNVLGEGNAIAVLKGSRHVWKGPIFPSRRMSREWESGASAAFGGTLSWLDLKRRGNVLRDRLVYRRFLALRALDSAR